MACLHEVLCIHEEKLRLAGCLECCSDHKVLRLLLKHECRILEHDRIHRGVNLDNVYTVHLHCHALECALECKSLLLGDLFHLLLERLVLLYHLSDGACEVRYVVEECFCSADGFCHLIYEGLCTDACHSLDTAYSGSDCRL